MAFTVETFTTALSIIVIIAIVLLFLVPMFLLRCLKAKWGECCAGPQQKGPPVADEALANAESQASD
jgi:hypothetical protein